MRCFIDMDGVVVNLYPEILKSECWDAPNPWPDGKDLLDIMGVSFTAMFWDKYKAKFWRHLPKTPYADAILKACFDKFGEENCWFLSRPSNGSSAKGKWDWVGLNYPQMLHRTYLGWDKSGAAHGGAVLIDDSDSNIRDFEDAGGTGILIPQPWNEASDCLHDRVGYLKQFLDPMVVS